MLPEGDKVVEDLETEFLPSVDELLAELHDKRVTGYVEFEGSGSRGFAALDAGDPGKIKLVTRGEEETFSGAEGLKDVFDSGSYTVQVVDTSESGREIVEIKLNNQEIKTDMSADDVDLPKFLKTNITEQNNDCHIVVFGDAYSGVVTMVDGIPAQAKVSTEDEILIGDDALRQVLDGADAGEVVIDIYRISDEEGERDEVAEEVIGERMEEELSSISSDFEEKADDLLDDMGLGFVEGEGDGGGDGLDMGDVEAEVEDELGDELGGLMEEGDGEEIDLEDL
ncbi:MAG: hypothetical protein ACOCT0_03195 [Halobacteriota archaeon]